MTKVLRKAAQLFFSILLFEILTMSTYAGERVPIPEGVYFYRSASSVFGFESAWINPAGLGKYSGSGVLLMADYFNDDFAKSYGAMINGEQSAVAYRRLDNPLGTDFQEWVFATGLGLGQMNIGGSYRVFKSGPDIYDDRHFWNFGLQMRGDFKLSGAVVFSNLNRGRIDGERTEVEHRYSVSYRPINTTDLTLSVDMFRTSSISIGDAVVAYSASYSPYPGLIVDGYFDTEDNFNIGVRANLTKYFVGNESRFNKGDGRGTTLYFGTTDLKQPSLIPWSNKRLSIVVPGKLDENPSRPVFGKHERSFYSLLSSIYRAAEDESIKEIVIKLRQPSFGFAQAQELRDALKFFKKTGKTLVCHLSMPNNIGYYIASISDSVLIPPVSQLDLVGLKAELTFYAGTLEKLGAELDMVRIGDYKSAPERYTEKHSTTEAKEQIDRLLDDIFAQFVGGIADGREISVDSVKQIVDNGPYTSEEAIKFGLVDGLSYADEMTGSFLSDLTEILLYRYEKDTLVNDGWPTKPKIAVIVAEGGIQFKSGDLFPISGGKNATPSELSRAFKRAESDPNVKAIVLRVNSPGGFALAGEEILHSASKAAEKKPLIVSMGNVAASGGYFISMAAEKLYADAGTITGSIGIYGGKLNLEKLYDKIDLTKELYTRGKYAGMLSSVRPFTDDEREKFRSHLLSFYKYFTGLVAENRTLSSDSIEQLSQGKVWTGQEAVQNGLIDEVGGLKQALDYTVSQLKLYEYDVVFYPERRPLVVLPVNSLFTSIAGVFGLGNSSTDPEITPLEILDNEGIFARMPFDITID